MADEWIEGLEESLERLGETADATSSVVSGFESEMRGMRTTAAEAGREVKVLSGGIGRSLRSSFEGLAFDGMRLSDAMRGVALSMADAALGAAVNPVMKQVSGGIAGGIGSLMAGVLPFGQGGSFTQGRVMPFAKGGVVSGPTTFPMRGATGLMGEAGPEAILPLSRGADGSLGVKGGGGQTVNVTMNISTPDVAGFQRSQSQIAAQMGRALGRGQRNR